MSAHTPGPWFALRESNVVTQLMSPERRIAVSVIDGGDDAEGLANAKLIAAAPELAEALIRLCQYCEECDDDSTALFNARAALAKAGVL